MGERGQGSTHSYTKHHSPVPAKWQIGWAPEAATGLCERETTLASTRNRTQFLAKSLH
jgi:hypothetical protein